jgi:arylsulfatase A-like enzyme
MKVILIVVRGLPLSLVGCYGNEWIATPNLDRLATEGVVYDRHYIACPDERPIQSVWQSGNYPCVSAEAPSRGKSPSQLLSHLRSESVPTFLVAERDRREGSFDEWREIDDIRDFGGLVKTATQRIEQLHARPKGLLWIDTGILLPPWSLPSIYRSHYFEELANDPDTLEELVPIEDLSAKELGWHDTNTVIRAQRSLARAVTYFDAGLGKLLEAIDQQGGRSTLILVTSDRGQALGEHGMGGANVLTLYEEIVHVPLLVRLPDNANAGVRVRTPTQDVDMLATIIEALGLSAPATHGRSVLSLCSDEAASIRPYAASCRVGGDSLRFSIRTSEWAYFIAGAAGADAREELYVKPDDRWEVNNVVQHHQELAQGFRQTVERFLQTIRMPGLCEYPPLAREYADLTPPIRS